MNRKDKHTVLPLISFISFLILAGFCLAQPTPFAENGTLKMLYDNRMYPQAVEDDGDIYIVWRGAKGLPYIISYDLASESFSKPVMLLDGLDIEIDTQKYESDHHYAPVIWIDSEGHLHTLLGCHGNSGGVHLVSAQPRQIAQWKESATIYESISYPQVHQIYRKQSLVYFRDRGHLGSWTYRTSSDNGETWTGPQEPVVDLDRAPHMGYLADHAGSYQTTQVSRDGRTLHVAFIWKVEQPVPNTRYKDFLGDHTQRYNLYYLSVDLASGRIYNYDGKKLNRPVGKRTADQDCLVWDTEERVAAVPPSIGLDRKDQPYFVLPVSEETPFRCWYYFVRYEDGAWLKTAITRTPHPFNACHLNRSDDGILQAYLVTGDSESIPGTNMDQYGWGDSVELWTSVDTGRNWTLSTDLTPVPGIKYQNVQFVSGKDGRALQGILLFYGWHSAEEPGTVFLWKR